MRLETAPKPSLNQQLAALPKMDRIALQGLWERLFLKPPNRALRREVLVPIIAYRLQELALGGLKGSIERKLRALGEDGSEGHRIVEGLTRHKAGTRYVREWQGKLHEVSVLPEGYEYNGHIHGSLSEIARNITGTRWSGPAFFGLKRRATERAA
ncbi:MAG: DUF2924 domain-containing protein [Terracidiphilus sp.]